MAFETPEDEYRVEISAEELASWMERWGMDTNGPVERGMEQRRLAERWMRHLKKHTYYAQAVLLPYNYLGVRGIMGFFSTPQSTQLYAAGQERYFEVFGSFALCCILMCFQKVPDWYLNCS